MTGKAKRVTMLPAARVLSAILKLRRDVEAATVDPNRVNDWFYRAGRINGLSCALEEVRRMAKREELRALPTKPGRKGKGK
jgi:hypothetical protein